MHIAIFGANSQIAQDLVRSFASARTVELSLFVRNRNKLDPSALKPAERRDIKIFEYAEFDFNIKFDAIINFVGIGDPALASKMGAAIFDITYEYDKIALDYIQLNRHCRYIFLSSGAAYGGDFIAPVQAQSLATFDINNLKTTDWYAIAKFYAEARHRAHKDLSIVDIRVFNYFSHTQDLSARYFITDAIRAIKENTKLLTSPSNMFRDYITPLDFFNLISKALTFDGKPNMAIDCYTKAPTDKFSILSQLQKNFGLQFNIENATHSINATGTKLHYYSENKTASTLGYAPHFNSIEGLNYEIKKCTFFK